jgi:hypothetical protein
LATERTSYKVISTWLEMSWLLVVVVQDSIDREGGIGVVVHPVCHILVGWRNVSSRKIGMSMDILCLVKYFVISSCLIEVV